MRIHRLEFRLAEVSGSLLEARQLVLDYINNRRSLNDLAVWLIDVQQVVSIQAGDDSLEKMLKAAGHAATVGHEDSQDSLPWD